MIRLSVREMHDSERSMVLANWKHQLSDQRKLTGWGRYMRDQDFWALVNHVVDHITFPKCRVYVGTHPESDIPVCWAAVAEDRTTNTGTVMFLYCREAAREDPELAAGLERALVAEITKNYRELRLLARYNPFKELKR